MFSTATGVLITVAPTRTARGGPKIALLQNTDGGEVVVATDAGLQWLNPRTGSHIKTAAWSAWSWSTWGPKSLCGIHTLFSLPSGRLAFCSETNDDSNAIYALDRNAKKATKLCQIIGTVIAVSDTVVAYRHFGTCTFVQPDTKSVVQLEIGTGSFCALALHADPSQATALLQTEVPGFAIAPVRLDFTRGVVRRGSPVHTAIHHAPHEGAPQFSLHCNAAGEVAWVCAQYDTFAELFAVAPGTLRAVRVGDRLPFGTNNFTWLSIFCAHNDTIVLGRRLPCMDLFSVSARQGCNDRREDQGGDSCHNSSSALPNPVCGQHNA